MFLRSSLDLFDFCQYFDFKINSIFEIGVSTADRCRSTKFIENNIDVSLFEPDQNAYQSLLNTFSSYKNCKIYNVAISDYTGNIDFYLNGERSFISSVDKPPLLTDNPIISSKESYPKISIFGDTIDKYDNGNIDLLLLDMEGAEYFALKHLKSLPKIIGIETHCENRYTNPFIEQIHQWLNDRTYKVLFKNTSDSFFIRGNDLGWGNGGNDNWKA